MKLLLQFGFIVCICSEYICLHKYQFFLEGGKKGQRSVVTTETQTTLCPTHRWLKTVLTPLSGRFILVPENSAKGWHAAPIYRPTYFPLNVSSFLLTINEWLKRNSALCPSLSLGEEVYRIVWAGGADEYLGIHSESKATNWTVKLFQLNCGWRSNYNLLQTSTNAYTCRLHCVFRHLRSLYNLWGFVSLFPHIANILIKKKNSCLVQH